ncbi:MAG: hypothetical protein ACK55I_11035 [bacterium]
MISGSQQSSDLKEALESENEKTKLMEESMQKLDEEMKRSDILLAQMMPKSVSDKVREQQTNVVFNIELNFHHSNNEEFF